MNEPSISTQPADRHAGQVQRGLRSLTPNGLGLILLVCVINALRRTLPKDELGAFFSDLPGVAAWLVVMAHSFRKSATESTFLPGLTKALASCRN